MLQSDVTYYYPNQRSSKHHPTKQRRKTIRRSTHWHCQYSPWNESLRLRDHRVHHLLNRIHLQ